MVFDTECVACLHAGNEMGSFFLPSNILFVSIQSLARKERNGKERNLI